MKDNIVQLPHDAEFDTRSGTVSLSIGRVKITMTLEEFTIFIEDAHDIYDYISQIVVYEQEKCPSCNTELNWINIKPQDEKDYN
jgi:hypothetical protein